MYLNRLVFVMRLAQTDVKGSTSLGSWPTLIAFADFVVPLL